MYDGSGGSEPKNPLYGFTKHSQLYFKANPNYEGRYLVPTLWDKKRETIVNNESSEIIRMFYSTFDAFVDHSRRESVRAMLPDGKRAEIEAMNEWVYDTINNGVYKTGFASTQKAYNESVRKLFESLDRIEAHLETNGSKYLLGDHITEADVRLYPTIVRFDVAYHTLFKCNLKMIRHDYPRLHTWLRTLYWDRTEETNGGAFADTTHWEPIKGGYTYALKQEIVPAGPAVEILPLGTD